MRSLGAPLLAADEESLWGAALDALGPFASTASLVRSRASRELRSGVALSEQPSWVRASGALRAIADALGAHGCEGLPVALNLRDELVEPPLYAAPADALPLLEGSAIARALASPTFATVAPEWMVRPLPLRRVAASLEADATRADAVSAHPRWRHLARREALYAWLLAHPTEIARDPEARASLGRACVIPSRGGVLRAPGEFLHEDIADLDADWHVADEVPSALRAWLREAWSLETARLNVLVKHLLDSFARAAAIGDDARMDALLGHLARSVRTPEALASLQKAEESVKEAKGQLDKVVGEAQDALKKVEAVRSSTQKAVQTAQQALEKARAEALKAAQESVKNAAK